MISYIKSLFKRKSKPTKLIMLWNRKEVEHWAVTEDEYDKFMKHKLPLGVSVLSVMDI